MNKPHKHAEVIKAWADGVPIQVRYPGNTSWNDITAEGCPAFLDHREYRIKPEKRMVKIKLVRAHSATAVIVSLLASSFGEEASVDKAFRDWITVKDWFEVEYEDV